MKHWTPVRALMGVWALAFIGLHVGLRAIGQPVSGGDALQVEGAVPGRPLSAEQERLLALDAKASLTVVTFFESWCGPCMLELPQLQRLWQQYHGDGLAVLGVYSDASGGKVEQLVARMGLQFNLRYDHDGQLSRAFAIRAVPSMVVIDAQNQVLRFERGYDPATIHWLERQVQARALAPATTAGQAP